MQKGDPILVTIAGRQLEGVIYLMSENGPAAILVDEGVPAPFSLLGTKQIILLTKHDDSWVDVPFDRPVQIG
jgi:hypothetical protein